MTDRRAPLGECENKHAALEKWIKAELKAVNISIGAAKEAIGAKAAQASAAKATAAIAVSVIALILTAIMVILVLARLR